MEYLVSIVIPHYNSLEQLKVLLNSIPKDERIQIIIVDDNSYKNRYHLVEAIGSLKRKNIELYFNHEERGAGSCRNEGLKHIKGKWTVFADADDYFTQNAFKIIASYIDSDVDIIFFNPTSINMPGGELGTRHISYENMIRSYVEKPCYERELLLKTGFVGPWSKIIRSSIISDNHYEFDEVRWSNDVMFSIKCAFSAKRIGICDKTIYCITRDIGSLTTQRNSEEFRTRFEVYIRKYKYLQQILSKEDLKLVTNAPIGKVIKAFSNGYGLKMVKYILKRYREEGIPLLQIGKNTIKNVRMDVKKFRADKNYLIRNK